MKTLILAMLLITGCATGAWPRPLSGAEVRREVKACRATGMVPELVKEQGRVVWVQCWPHKEDS